MEKMTCQIKSHNWIYTDEYADDNKDNVRADKVCKRCGKIKLGWTGPTKKKVEEATDEKVPTMQEAYSNLPDDVQDKL